MCKLVVGESALVVSPLLAVKLGLNEAMVLQQIHYWLEKSLHVHEGRKWVYNSYKQWQVQFPFWSETTIKRTIKSLEEQGLITSGNFNHSKMDRTKWYSIDYELLAQLTKEGPTAATNEQNDTNKGADGAEQAADMARPIPESTTEITAKDHTAVFVEVIAYLNERTNAAYKPGTKKTRALIRERMREGFTLADFKKVIDVKSAEWLHDPKRNKYLRPITLFGTKFESYLNQKGKEKQCREEDFDLDD